MKIAIIGAGFTGLGAALALTKKDHRITVFESNEGPGGLAGGFSSGSWSWNLESHYHHLFGTDSLALKLGQEVGCRVNSYSTNTSTLIDDGKFYRLDNPLALLQFPLLGLIDKLRTGATIAFCKIWPFWQALESVTSQKFLTSLMGENSFNILWRPLFVKKFHSFWSQIGAVWFWARVKFRTQDLFYPEGGFTNLANQTVAYLKSKNVEFNFDTSVSSVKKVESGYRIATSKSTRDFDIVISTLLVSATQKIAPFYNYSGHLDSLGAINLILELKKPFLPDHIYWLNINDLKLPFLAIVEHTNLISSQYYGQLPLVYVGNYLPTGHEYFNLTAPQLVQKYLAGLRKINPGFSISWVSKSWVFKAKYAQSIVPTNFSSHLPPMVTDSPGFFVANIQQVYPQDRGVNYALKLGYQVANYVR